MIMQLPGYEFDEKIGEGGMATVFKGRQLSLARPVAIKILNRQMGHYSQIREAFERESLIIARLNHPNIIHVIDRGVSAEDTPYFVMEYVDGVDLATTIYRDSLPFKRKIEICLQICKALAYAHKNGVIHRDIKPANVIIDAELNVRVLDFGISLFYQQNEAALSHGCEQDVMGTFTYMAPELSDSASQATYKSDIYALGAIMYEIFTGLPFSPDRQPLASIADEVPERVTSLIVQCLAQQQDRRPESVTDVHDQLLQVLQGAHLNQQQRQRAQESIGKKTFTLLDILSENRYGSVYLFMEKNSSRQLVVKKVIGSEAGFAVSQRLANLDHPHIVKVHGASKNPRTFIVVMDYLKGGSLQDRLVRPYDIGGFLPIARQICAGLGFAHSHRILHGNLRASNILFDERGRVRIVDFGLPSHYRENGGSTGSAALALSLDPNRKLNGYRLPNERLTPQTDIYACGVIFYRMLIGELPRWHYGKLETGRAFKRLPPSLQEVLSQMLERNPQRRFKNVDQVRVALGEVTDDVPTVIVRSKPRRKVSVSREGTVSKKKQILLLLLLALFFLILVDTGAVVLYSSGHLDPGALQIWFSSLFGP